MIVDFSDQAEADLEAIGDHIAMDNPRRARTFIKELRFACKKIGDMPRGYQLVPRHEATGIRRSVHCKYLIFYHIVSGRIEILHVLHGAMDIDAVLFPQA